MLESSWNEETGKDIGCSDIVRSESVSEECRNDRVRLDGAGCVTHVHTAPWTETMSQERLHFELVT